MPSVGPDHPKAIETTDLHGAMGFELLPHLSVRMMVSAIKGAEAESANMGRTWAMCLYSHANKVELNPKGPVR